MSTQQQQHFNHVIFLDIDGVLLPFQHQQRDPLFPKRTTDAFFKLLQHAQDAQLVLSSTWRTRFVQDIVDALHVEFVDMTDPNLHSERQWEIQEWLHRHPECDVWLVLDDEELLLGDKNAKYRANFEGHVVKTDSEVGLTMEDVQYGLYLWSKQLKKCNTS